MASNDREVTKICREIGFRIVQAKTHQDIYDAVNIAIQYGHPIKYHHYVYKFLIVFSFIILFINGVYLLLKPDAFSMLMGIVMFACLMASSLSFYAITEKNKGIVALNRRIIMLDAFLDNNIDPKPIFAGKAWENYRDFKEFSRGNHSRRIIHEFESSPEFSVPFNYYRFEYIDKEEFTYPSKTWYGAYTLKTVTKFKKYYRSGFMIDFPFVKNIAICHHNSGIPIKPVDYQVASIEFSNKFNLAAKDRFELVKFLKPKVVELFTKFENSGTIFSVEVSHKGVMCISFPDDNYLPTFETGMKLMRNNAEDKEYGLDSPELFLLMLKDNTTINALHNAMSFMNQLVTYSKGNFR